MKPSTKRLISAVHDYAHLDDAVQRCGIDVRTTYVSVWYRPELPIDHLHLQGSEPGTWDDADPLRDEWLQLEQDILQLQLGECVSARVDTRNISRQRDATLRAIRMCETADRMLARTRKSRVRKIATLQRRQSEIIREIRRLNGAVVVERRRAAKAHREAEKEALAAGRFWECSEQTLKNYFSVPFRKRKLVDVSERHRAALFLDLDYEGYGVGLQPSGVAHLCGIDDNGEEWGFRLLVYRSYDVTVVDAMMTCWGVRRDIIERATRQGEILIWSENIPDDVRLESADDEHDIAPSHTVRSETLQINGEYFYATTPIIVEHPTHAAIWLQPGSYRYASHDMSADID